MDANELADASEQRLIDNAAKLGRLMDGEYARIVALAKDRLSQDESDDIARTILENFSKYLATGERVVSFTEFMI